MSNIVQFELKHFPSAESLEVFIHEFLTSTKVLREGYGNYRKKIGFITKKGTKVDLSIQANEDTYCHPRETSMEYKFYTEVEVGFPSWTFSKGTLGAYAEDIDEPTETVYPYIPISVVAEEMFRAIQEI